MAHTEKFNRLPTRTTMTPKLAAMTVSALLIAGCTGPGFNTDPQILSQNANDYVATHSGLSDAVKADIRLHRLSKGMSKHDVIAAWGKPVIVRKFGPDKPEFWYFGCDWPHTCTYPDHDDGYALIDEIYESQAKFEAGKLVYWRS
jgi:hypothetical protein